MESLRFLGWTLDFDGNGVRRPAGHGGSWSVVVASAAGRYAISGSFALQIGGTVLECAFSSIPLKKTGGSWVPSGGSLSRLAMWRSGESHNANGKPFFRVRFGGAIATSDQDEIPFTWRDSDGAVILRFDGFLFHPAGIAARPAEIEFASGRSIAVTAANGGALELDGKLWLARLHQWQVGSGTSVHRAEFSSRAVRMGFAATEAKGPFRLAFDAVDTTPVWLHGGQSHGPGLEVTGAGLEATFMENGSGGHILSALSLTNAGKLTVTTCGIMNSWNDAETWRTAGPIPLALAFESAPSAWNGPVIAPAAKVPMQQVGALPVHGSIGGHSFDVATDSTVELRSSDAAADPVAATATHGVAKDMAYRRTRPWVHFQKAVYSHPRYGETYLPQSHDAGRALRRSVVGADPTTVLRFQSTVAGGGGLPAVPREYWDGGEAAGRKGHADELDRAMAELLIDRPKATHESGLTDATNAPAANQKIASLFSSSKEPFPLRLEKHAEVRQLANPILKQLPVVGGGALTPPLSVPNLNPDQMLEYAVLWPGASWSGSVRPPELSEKDAFVEALYGRFLDPGVPIGIGSPRFGDTANQSRRAIPWLIAKLGRERTLEEILTELRSRLPAGKHTGWDAAMKTLVPLLREVDPGLLRTDWVGAIALELDLQLDAMPQLQAMVPTKEASSPTLRFVAVSPQSTMSSRWGGVSGAIDWKRTENTAYVANDYDDLDEARFWTDSLDVRWRDGALKSFRSEATLELRTFMGTGVTRTAASGSDDKKKPTRLQIIGSAKRRPAPDDAAPTYDFNFSADATKDNPDGLKVYPVSDAGDEADLNFIEEVRFRKVEIVASTTDGHTVPGAKDAEPPTSAKVKIDGDVKFKPPEWLKPSVPDFLNGKKISFFNLGIGLPSLSDFNIPGLKIDYPDLKFDLDLPHVGLLGDALKLKFQSFTLDWSKMVDLGSWPDLGLGGALFPSGAPDFNFDWPRIIFNGRLGFGQLPELFSGAFSEFSLDLLFALNLDLPNASLSKSFYIGVGGFGFEGLNLNLLPFLEISIEKLALERSTDPAGAKLTAVGASISILKYKLPYTVAGGFFSSSGPGAGDAFWVSATRNNGGDHLIDFNYGFIGQNIAFKPDSAGNIVQKFLEAPLLAKSGEKPDTALGENIFEKAWGKEVYPAGEGSLGDGMGWTFAAEIGAFWGIMRGRAIIQDRGYRGLALFVDATKPGGKVIREWFGDSFGFVGLHHKGATEDDDYFHMSLTLPEMNLPAFRMVGGVVATTLWTNGGFQVDFGFPWPSGSTRQWERTIGLIITPGQASAGFYFRKTLEHAPDGKTGLLTIGAGLAIQWGLGAAWGGGTFKAWGRIGVYGVVQGEVTLRVGDPNKPFSGDLALQRLYVVGAVGVLVEATGKIDWWVISVEVGVKATAELRFELDYQPSGPKTVKLAAELYVSAYAKACIGGGWFKVCKSITVGLSVPVHYQLKLG